MSPRKKTKNTVLCLLLLAVLLVCVGCRGASGTAGDPREYLQGAFEAEVRGEISGIPFEASLSHIPPSDSSPEVLTLTFTEPPALRGMTLCRQGGGLTVTLDGMCVDAAAWQGGALAALPELFSADTTLLSVMQNRDSDTYTATLTAPSGTTYTVITAADGIPLRIQKGEDLVIEILSFG